MSRLHSIEIETEYGICEVYLTEQEKKNIEEKCKSNCIECKSHCGFGYKAIEIMIDG